ncbi:hypothetical protein [Natrinema halophilum]|uniref:hypothetical protein n=1 Tax=Natrinema halophilum TaxID=1699371 RepID=UPI001F236AD5|nr:hypothetical protein [Natrinema halophilum]QLG50212.2 hypothetical protein HYG82_15810 [Natrinema halophilum]
MGLIDEDRTPTIQSAAFLSTLKFCRYLRGDDVERLKRHDLFDEDSPEADGIEFTRLRKTYRCHLDVTEFLRRWMYEQDGIKSVSDIDSTLETADGDVPNALHPVFEESPLILITHVDRGSQQRNEAEANLVSRLCKLVPGEEGVGNPLGPTSTRTRPRSVSTATSRAWAHPDYSISGGSLGRPKALDIEPRNCIGLCLQVLSPLPISPFMTFA